jgi:hypothetical protein
VTALAGPDQDRSALRVKIALGQRERSLIRNPVRHSTRITPCSLPAIAAVAGRPHHLMTFSTVRGSGG